jgi:hypothetical protein
MQPFINLDGISVTAVSATYGNLPPSSRIVFMNKTSGQPVGQEVDAEGSATISVPLPAGMPAGEYYLKAEDSAGGYLAQSVVFPLGGDIAGDSAE